LYGGVVFPYEVARPHSNHAVSGAPFGFTEAFSVADVLLTEVAGRVVTDGGLCGGVGRVHVRFEP
jgi:hypothetical protein